jgi:8-amino-7-oxononanoate synthase
VALAARLLRGGLVDLGIRPVGHGHIIPWIVGAPTEAVGLARALVARGVHVQAIRPPSVPVGTARLRLTVTARHEPADIERALAAIRDACSSG